MSCYPFLVCGACFPSPHRITTRVKKGPRRFIKPSSGYNQGILREAQPCMRFAHDCPPRGDHARAKPLIMRYAHAWFTIKGLKKKALYLVLCTRVIVPLVTNKKSYE